MRSAGCAEQVASTGDAALRVNSGGQGPVSAEWMIPKVCLLLSCCVFDSGGVGRLQHPRSRSMFEIQLAALYLLNADAGCRLKVAHGTL